MAAGFCTIGHSTRRFEVFVEMLREAGVTLVVDVRSFPRSRINPDYNIDGMSARLAPFQLAYVHMPDLGGRRAVQSDVSAHVNALWQNRSFHNYADYALSEAFNAALTTLMALGKQQCLAIMCAEAVWWRCHRRIITDYLLMNGQPVRHLMGSGRTEPAHLTPGAIGTGTDRVIYPSQDASAAVRPA